MEEVTGNEINKGKKPTLVYVILIVIVLFFGAFAGVWHYQNECVGNFYKYHGYTSPSICKTVSTFLGVETTVEVQEQGPIETRKHVYLPKNFVIEIPLNWETMAPAQADSVLPEGFFGTQFAFKKEGTSCVAAYVRTASSSIRNFDQANFATRVFTEGGVYQFDGSWYIHDSKLPEPFVFNRNTRRPALNGIRVNYFPGSYNSTDPDFNYMFVLFSEIGKTVPVQCDIDFSTMLSTISSEYEEWNISKKDTGIAYLGQDRLASRDSRKERYLFFEPDTDDIARKVMPIRVYRPTVYKGEFYHVDTEKTGDLLTLDLINQSTTTKIATDPSDNKVIIDYYFSDRNIYYLYAEDTCSWYMADCKNIELYKFDTTSKQSTLLIKDLTFRSIIGLDLAKNQLYINYADGDAGCFWISLGILDLNINKLVEESDYSGCIQYIEEEIVDTPLDEYNERIESFSEYSEAHGVIPIVNGTIVLPTGNESSAGGRQGVKYVK